MSSLPWLELILVAGHRVVCYCDITSVDIRSSHILDIFIFIRQGLEINEIDLKHRRQGCFYCTAPSLRGNPSTTRVSKSTCSLGTLTCPSVQVLRKQKFNPSTKVSKIHSWIQNHLVLLYLLNIATFPFTPF